MRILIAVAAVAGVATLALAGSDDAEMARLNAEAMKLDPADYPFVQPVCTACHTPEMFLRYRSWEEWQGVFKDMLSYGAGGTQEQWDHIATYFLRTLTVVNVNKAREEELIGALQVDEKTAISVVQHRPYRSAADLKAVAGVKPAVIDTLQDESRLEF
jgi:DNA uptake protein ComE-like DNA-binding protein